MTDRLISEQAVMESLTKEYNQKRTGDGLKLTWIEKAVSATPTASDWDRYSTALWREAYERGKRDGQSSAQPNLQSTCNQLATDCISRQEALDKLEPWLKVKGYSEGELNMLKAVLYELRLLPSIQPEIIRCNSCKHWTQSTGKMNGYGLGRCDFHDADLVACNGFCYWAERRTDVKADKGASR